MKTLKNVGLVILILGILASLGIMISTTSSTGRLSDALVTLGFYLWVALPFLALIALTLFVHRKGRSNAARVAVFVTSIIVTVASVLVYWTSVFHSESSTSALVFVFIPLYALVSIAVVYVLAWLLSKLFMTKSVV
jgi:hypothetical protein